MFCFRLPTGISPTDPFSFNMVLLFIINLVRLTTTSTHIIAIIVLVFAARRTMLVIEMPLSQLATPSHPLSRPHCRAKSTVQWAINPAPA